METRQERREITNDERLLIIQRYLTDWQNTHEIAASINKERAHQDEFLGFSERTSVNEVFKILKDEGIEAKKVKMGEDYLNSPVENEMFGSKQNRIDREYMVLSELSDHYSPEELAHGYLKVTTETSKQELDEYLSEVFDDEEFSAEEILKESEWSYPLSLSNFRIKGYGNEPPKDVAVIAARSYEESN